MGKLTAYDAKKTHLIKVRVTKEEYDDIMAIARDKDTTPSEVIRNFYRTIKVLFSEKISFGDMILKVPQMEAIIRGKNS